MVFHIFSITVEIKVRKELNRQKKHQELRDYNQVDRIREEQITRYLAEQPYSMIR